MNLEQAVKVSRKATRRCFDFQMYKMTNGRMKASTINRRYKRSCRLRAANNLALGVMLKLAGADKETVASWMTNYRDALKSARKGL